ncbi:MAG TPA: acyltransferase [Paludibacter sp.]|nr:acyltransferase [Paludibacter sp.]
MPESPFVLASYKLLQMKYFERIDGLRFVAISLVLIEHFASTIGTKISAGYYGVDLFFVISGFLITSILFKSKEKSFGRAYKNFIGRRTLRIFPIYYATIIILWILNLEIVRDKFVWLITYSFNYAWVLYDIPSTPINHFWSLCVEEQFYLFWPFIVLSLRNYPKTLITLIFSIITFGYMQAIFNVIPEISKYNQVNILTRMSSLGIGAFGAVYSANYKLSEKFFRNTVVEIAILILLVVSLVFPFKFQYISLAFISLYLVLKATKYEFSIEFLNKFLTNKKIVYIGTISYGIYVFHLPIAYYFSLYLFDPLWTNIDFSNFGIFEKIRLHSWIIKFPLYTTLSILFASISFKYFEKPILKMKDKYFNNNDNQNP